MRVDGTTVPSGTGVAVMEGATYVTSDVDVLLTAGTVVGTLVVPHAAKNTGITSARTDVAKSWLGRFNSHMKHHFF
jgi:hypothetical protein